MRNELEIMIMNSATVYEDLSDNLLHSQINSQLDNGTDIDLGFMEAPKPCGDNYECISEHRRVASITKLESYR